MIEAIVFDVDDTIYDQQEPYRRAMKKVFPNFRDEDMNKAYIRFRHHSDVGFPKVMSEDWTIEEMRFHRTNETLKDLGYEEIDLATGTHFQEIYVQELDNITMLDEMKLTLEFLKSKNVPVGVITNGPTEHQLKKVKQLGLYEYVDSDHVIVSQATGFQKPEKEIFELAAKQFSLNPATTIYVGDSYDNDVTGAHNGGWKSMWFNHRGRTLADGVKPVFDIEIDSFEQLFGAVKVLFDLPASKFIVDLNDKTNPILEKGIHIGLKLAAEKLLAKDLPFEEVISLLELPSATIKELENKGYH
ncbi:MAG: HAD family hydrolase [Lactobacillales bacterium]|jgi:putative hydrolase of the HAD superfamily|nr:HAD family hydrolase [Lactobacillales bacterium]